MTNICFDCRTPYQAPTKAGIVGVGLNLPGGIVSCADLWAKLSAGEDSIIQGTRNSEFPGKQFTGGYLSDEAFDPLSEAGKFGIDMSEAKVMDPQHILALHLVDRMWQDVGSQVKPHTCVRGCISLRVSDGRVPL